MKKVSVKKQLVDFMIENGNDFRYTDMIKAVLRICKGKNYVYNREYDRGFYATNFSSGSNGYMVNGGGDCGIYKNENGRWSAKYYTKVDKINYIIDRQINILSSAVSLERYVYDNHVQRLSIDPTNYSNEDRRQEIRHYSAQYRNKVQSHKSEARNKIAKAMLKLV